jgi:hypothetical protein
MDNLFFKKGVLFEWFRDRSCWGIAESEDQRKNRQILKDLMNRRCLFLDEAIFIILNFVAFFTIL